MEKGREDGWAWIFSASSCVFPEEGNPHPENDQISLSGTTQSGVCRGILATPSQSTNPQRSCRPWFATLFSSFALLSATLSSTPFPVNVQWHEGPMALSTYARHVRSTWTPWIAFSLRPEKDEFCSHCFLKASMPGAGWLPLRSDPIGSCDVSKVALLDCFPLVIGPWRGRNCGSPSYCLLIGLRPGAYQE